MSTNLLRSCGEKNLSPHNVVLHLSMWLSQEFIVKIEI